MDSWPHTWHYCTLFFFSIYSKKPKTFFGKRQLNHLSKTSQKLCLYLHYLLQCTQLKRKMSILNCFRLFCVCVACVYVYAPHVCVWCPQRSGEGAGCPGVGVTDSCGPCGCWEHVLVTVGQLCPDNEYCSRFCSYRCYHILSSWIHSQQCNREHPQWEVNRLTTGPAPQGRAVIPLLTYYYQC